MESTSPEREKSDQISLFYIDKMRRYPGDPALFDVDLHNPQTDEHIEVLHAGAEDVAQAIHTRAAALTPSASGGLCHSQ